MINILTENDDRITQPSNIKLQLFNHQKTIIKNDHFKPFNYIY